MTSFRVLHIVHLYLPRHRHGTELHVHELAKRQQVLGYEVAVVAGEKGLSFRETKLDRETVDGLDVYRLLFSPRSELGWLNHPEVAKSTRDILDEFRPDVVHVHQLATLSLSVLDAVFDVGVPAVMTLHDYSLICARNHLMRGDGSFCHSSDLADDCAACLASTSPFPKPGLLDWITLSEKILTSFSGWRRGAERIGQMVLGVKPPMNWKDADIFQHRNEVVLEKLKRVNVLHAPGGDLARRFETFADLPKDTIQPISAAVELPQQAESIPKTFPPLRVGFVGKITPLKGLHLLFDAVEKLPGESIELHISGEPTWTDPNDVAYWRRLRARAEHLPVTFHERFLHREVLNVMAQFDVLAVPSICAESFGRMVQEAFGAGVPVLCSNVGGLVDQVEDGVSGLHVRVGDAEAWAEAFSRLLGDSRLLPRLRRGVPAPNDIDQYVQKIDALYREAISHYSREGNP
jgi:glycosyltransferase involved in cell wall biosynthesis